MRYLQVRNSSGELVGLMSGEFLDEWIRRGWISFVESKPLSAKIDPEWITWTTHNLNVQWWARQLPDDYETWPCLVTDLPIDTLKRIRFFR